MSAGTPKTVTVIDRRYNIEMGMGDRAVYCARLESVCAERHQGFESPPIRQLANNRLIADAARSCSFAQGRFEQCWTGGARNRKG